MDCYEWRETHLLVRIYLQPRASQDEVVGIHDGKLKIRITAAPVDNQANQHLIKYLSKIFAVAKNQLQVVHGLTSRNKLIRVQAPRKLPPQIKRPQLNKAN